jgi:hypothetical protein
MIAIAQWTKVSVLDSRSGAVRSALGGFNQVITGVSFSPDGQRVLATSYDQHARLFDPLTGAVLADGIGCGDGIASQPTWSTGAPAMVGYPGAGTAVGTVCAVDANGRPDGPPSHTTAWAIPQTTADRTLYVGIALSPLATIVQDVASGTVLGSIPGLGLLEPVARNLVLTSPATGDITMWSLDPSVWKSRACDVAGRNLTEAEWQRYLPDEPYRATCPQFAPA